MHPLRSQRIDGDGGTQGTVDPTGKAKDDTRKAVLLHIVLQAEDHGVIDPFHRRAGIDQLARLADPAIAFPPPVGDQQAFLPARHLHR